MLGFKKVGKMNFKPFEIQRLIAHAKQVRNIKRYLIIFLGT